MRINARYAINSGNPGRGNCMMQYPSHFFGVELISSRQPAGTKMKALRAVLLLLFFSLSTSAFAFRATDYQCLNNCTSRGYMYQYCQQQCSYETSPAPAPVPMPAPAIPSVPSFAPQKIPQIDYQCMNDCTSNGYMYQFCQSRCSY